MRGWQSWTFSKSRLHVQNACNCIVRSMHQAKDAQCTMHIVKCDPSAFIYSFNKSYAIGKLNQQRCEKKASKIKQCMEWTNERSTRSETTNRTIGTQNTALPHHWTNCKHTSHWSTYGWMHAWKIGESLFLNWIPIRFQRFEWSNLSVLCFEWT